MKLVVLSGGTGTPKLLEGLEHILGQENLYVIVNTADNFWHLGLYVCPDVDTVVYLFSNLLDKDKYWGIKGDTFNSLEMLKLYGMPGWFHLGDKDLAMHIIRTYLLNKGYRLTSITKYICGRLRVKARILPMCDEHVETYVLTNLGELHIQEYLVKYKSKPRVYGITFPGLKNARATADELHALDEADAIIIGPSNPINSIGPILGVKPIRDAIRSKRNNGIPVIAISPIIGGRALTGPAHIFMEALGYEPSPYGVAEIYSDLVSDIIIHETDKGYVDRINKEFNINVHVRNIIMGNLDDKISLAKYLINTIIQYHRKKNQ